MVHHGEMRIFILEAELKMDACHNKKRIRMFGPNLAVCQLGKRAENAVKFKLKLTKNWQRKPSKNEVGMDWETKCGKF